MRSSARESDPGYATFAYGSKVLVNGVEVQKCFTADEELGEAWCFDLGPNGVLSIDQEKKNCKRVCHRGVVEIVLPRGLRKPRRRVFVRMFKPRFATLVEAGTKRQTVRPEPKRVPRRGDIISLRTWTGKPYRSKQRVLRVAMVTYVWKVHINEEGISLFMDGVPFKAAAENFARSDGFSSFAEMCHWFQVEHGLPFSGIVIYWEVTPP